jgi:hypothetical protein
MKSYFEALELPDLETRSPRKKGEAHEAIRGAGRFAARGYGPCNRLLRVFAVFVIFVFQDLNRACAG